MWLPVSQYPGGFFASSWTGVMPGWASSFPSLFPCPWHWLGRCSVHRDVQEGGHSWLTGTAALAPVTSWFIFLLRCQHLLCFCCLIPLVFLLPCCCLLSCAQMVLLFLQPWLLVLDLHSHAARQLTPSLALAFPSGLMDMLGVVNPCPQSTFLGSVL